jgi:rSAM/selenodomain-associated transferase 1
MTRVVSALFAKAPTPGEVKTRLARTIGDDAACRLYRALGRRTARVLAKSGVEARVFFTPPDAAREVADWLGGDIPLHPQRGETLGERMANAAAELSTLGAERIVIVGCDGPELTAPSVREAVAALDDADLAFIPTYDGGYILVALRRPAPGLFEDMAYGHDRVMAETLERASALGLTVVALPVQRDLDTVEDLAYFPEWSTWRE